MSQQKYKILIVDDEPEILGLLQNALEPLGAELVFAENGIVAANLVEQTRFDLIVTDIRMPDVDGFRLGRIVKNSKLNCDSKIIVLAGFVDEDRAKQCVELGVVEALEKPFRPKQLRYIIAKHLAPDQKLSA